VQGSHAWQADGAVFDEDNIVSHAGLVPLLELAERAGCRGCWMSMSGSSMSG